MIKKPTTQLAVLLAALGLALGAQAIIGTMIDGKAAALLAAPDPQAALTQHEQQQRSGGMKPLAQIAPKISAQLEANAQLMQQLGFAATPAILYKDEDGYLKSMKGAP